MIPTITHIGSIKAICHMFIRKYGKNEMRGIDLFWIF